MDHLRQVKENMMFYWKQRKYQLSVFGVSPKFDWHILILFLSISLIWIAYFGYVNNRSVANYLLQQTKTEDTGQEQQSLNEIKKVLAEYEMNMVDFEILLDGREADGGDSVSSVDGESGVQ